MRGTFIRPATIGAATVLVVAATCGAALASAGHGPLGAPRAGFGGFSPGEFGLGAHGGPGFSGFGQGASDGLVGHGPGGALAAGGGFGASGTHDASVLDADVLDPAASYLGIAVSKLESDLEGGKTLAQEVTTVGGSKTTAGLVAAIVASEQGILAADQTAGWITSAQETALLGVFTNEITSLVGSGPTVPPAPRQPRPGLLQTAASFLGVTLPTLQSDLGSGKTLAQVAAAQGKQVSDLITTLEAGPKAKLDAELSAGTISAPQENTILANLTTRLTAIVNGTGSGHTLNGFALGLAGFAARPGPVG